VCSSDLEVSLVWHFRQNNIISLMVRYPTFGHYNPRFGLYRGSSPGGDDGNTITLCIAYSMEKSADAHNPENRNTTDEYFLQCDVKEFTGKRVTIKSAGGELATFQL
jgi:hypothetical protein